MKKIKAFLVIGLLVVLSGLAGASSNYGPKNNIAFPEVRNFSKGSAYASANKQTGRINLAAFGSGTAGADVAEVYFKLIPIGLTADKKIRVKVTYDAPEYMRMGANVTALPGTGANLFYPNLVIKVYNLVGTLVDSHDYGIGTGPVADVRGYLAPGLNHEVTYITKTLPGGGGYYVHIGFKWAAGSESAAWAYGGTSSNRNDSERTGFGIYNVSWDLTN